MGEAHTTTKGAAETVASLPKYAWPGGYMIIYWFEDEHRIMSPLCADCVEEAEKYQWGNLVGCESGDAYEEDLRCDHCGTQLAAYYEEEEEDAR